MGITHEDKTVEEKQELLIQAVRDAFKSDEHFVICISSNEEDTTLTCQAFGASSANLIGAGIVSFIKDQPPIKSVVVQEMTKMMIEEMVSDMGGDTEEEEVAAIPEPISAERH